jgi:two-component system NtrC family sensor kinase
MMPLSSRNMHTYPDPVLRSERYYQQMRQRQTLRLMLLYLLPLVALTVYFAFQYRRLLIEIGKTNLKTIAANQADTLDLFLRERALNLSNLIDNPKLQLPPTSAAMHTMLNTLRSNSEVFVDVGFFDSNGIQVIYAGPLPWLEKRDYSRESWWYALKDKKDNFVITDNYLGFRQKPHLTIAVSRIINNQYVALRAALDSDKLSRHIANLESPNGVYSYVVNKAGYYQVVTPQTGSPLVLSSIVPPRTPKLNAEETEIGGSRVYYGYSWLRVCDWALIVRPTTDLGAFSAGGPFINLFAFSAAIIFLIFSIIVIRAKRIVQQVEQTDKAQAELSDDLLHASKLAAVGELASGIAHEINNPLAIINEEAGLIKDMMNPDFKMAQSLEDIRPSVDNIQDAVSRCREITTKLLAFVRRTEMNLQSYDIHEVIDDVLKGFYAHQLAVSNIEIMRKYHNKPLRISADRIQLQQVFLNLITNAADAIRDRGKITISTWLKDGRIYAAVADTGIGMTQELLDKIFLPFFTTKAVGEGTGLGLSISYRIIKGLGGNISVTSTLGGGSTFTVDLPLMDELISEGRGTAGPNSSAQTVIWDCQCVPNPVRGTSWESKCSSWTTSKSSALLWLCGSNCAGMIPWRPPTAARRFKPYGRDPTSVLWFWTKKCRGVIAQRF